MTSQRLENGDTVLVPPIGPQVTVEGMVRRPAIYELKDEKNLASVLELSGGLLPTAALRHIEVERTLAHEKKTMLSFDIPDIGAQDSGEVTKKLESFEIQGWGPYPRFSDSPLQPRRNLSGRARDPARALFLSCGDARHRRGSFVQRSLAGTRDSVRRNHSTQRARFSSERRKLRSCRRTCESRTGTGAASDGYDSRVQPIRFRRSASRIGVGRCARLREPIALQAKFVFATRCT